MDARIPESVRPLLRDYTQRLKAELPDLIYGVYLYGSIALSGFEEENSDIDFVTLLHRGVTNAEIETLENIHHALLNANPLAKRMDGMYIRLDDIGKTNPSLEPYPYCDSGAFKPSGHYDVNHVTWWVLKQQGITVMGKSVEELHIPTQWFDVGETMKYNVHEYWAPKGNSLLKFWLDGWVEFAVLTLCRIYYALFHEDIIPKRNAVEQALQELPSEWHLLLRESLRIRYHSNEPSLFPSRIKRAKETQRFIRYICKLSPSKTE
ncbi:aminoglycoside adenylyltransferase domain-containing protein [Brevibacillus sp. NPDC003359]|uniref:aminoglycoside adenylyltransferase domain-containing protein n=1 Tax=unclassified Brevibacillus TaxID=2684853 RepID=UPI0036B39960